VTPDLHFAASPVAAGDDAVHENPWITKQVQRLPGVPHHREPEFTVEDEWLNRTEARAAVVASGYHEEYTGID
jgi:hypothetical protein